MKILINFLVFYVGAIFGSIFAFLRKKISNGEKILGSGEKCDSCKKEISFWNKIPFFSYIFTGGQCKLCKEKYGTLKFITEIITGLVFLAAFNSVGFYQIFTNPNIYTNTTQILLKAGFIVTLPLTYGFIYLLGTVESDTEKINPNIMTYGVIVAAIEMILKFIVNIPGVTYTKYDLFVASFYIVVILAFFVLQMVTYKKDSESRYVIDIVMLVFILTIFWGSVITIATIIVAIIYIILGYIFGIFGEKEYKENIIVKKKNGKIESKKEGAYVTKEKHIAYSKILGFISIFMVISNHIVAMMGLI